ncbi:MAG: FMN-binding protein [Spirochaetia bacterium]
MKSRTRKRIAATAMASAMTIGTLAYGAGTLPGPRVARTAAYGFSDGRFIGRREYAYYGFVQVTAIVRNGKLTDIQVPEFPNDNGRSRYINDIALPYLIQEAVSAQKARVDLISGATFTSAAFVKSLEGALARAGK